MRFIAALIYLKGLYIERDEVGYQSMTGDEMEAEATLLKAKAASLRAEVARIKVDEGPVELRALLALCLDRLQEAGGTLDHKLQHQIVVDLQQDIRQGGQNALTYWREEIQAQKSRADLAEERAKLFAKTADEQCARADAADSKLADRTAELQRSQFRSNEFQARMQLAQAPPSTEAWQKLVHLAGIEGSGADFIYQITHSYNAMLSERDAIKAKLAALLAVIPSADRLEEMAEQLTVLRMTEMSDQLRDIAAAVRGMGKDEQR